MTALGMNTNVKYTPAIQFGTTDLHLETTNPKVGAAINASASQAYDDNSGGGMNLHFYTTQTDPGPNQTTTERLRILDNGQLWHKGPAGLCFVIQNSASSNLTSTQTLQLRHSATAIGSGGTVSFRVYADGDVENSNGTYGTISDLKLKENIVDAGSQWSDVKAVRVRKYNFKEETGHETHTQIGVVAQELETVSPGLVSETPDLDDSDNDLGTVTKRVKTSVLYMKALKALQEAMERIEQLETKVAALEAG